VSARGENRAPDLVGASAGSGKTHRLTEIVVEAVDPRRSEAIDLEGLIAVTYTQKGAAELASRIRQSFAKAGAHDTTHLLPLAHIGTVHAVCLRLIKEFAIDAGLSPLVDVMPGSEERLLRQALEWGLDPDLRRRLDELSAALELRLDPKTNRVDWVTPVHDIMTLARSNRIPPEALPAMAQRSASRLLELLGPEEADGAALDAALVEALNGAATALAAVDDGQKNTAKVKELVRTALRDARAQRLKWRTWLELATCKPGKAATHAVEALHAVAARVEGHPRLREQIRELTLTAYEAARQGLDAYDRWKRRRRIVDFVDMLDRALTLVEHPEVRAELAARFSLLVVDEFQDTSPIQLALFVRLHALAGRSTWVGDRKQCIFEYAGADPELMEAVAHWARASGGGTEQLPHNWRSRPELVEGFNALFTAALRRHGYSPEEVRTAPKRSRMPELDALAPFGLWALAVKNQDEAAHTLAEGVRRLLADADATPIVDRATGAVRPVRPGDIAVLVATNKEAEQLAGALAERGVQASIARAGLLATPEGVLSVAALRWLLDPENALAAAEVEALTGFRGRDPDAWLDEWLARQAARQSALAAGEAPVRPESVGVLARLEPLRSEIHGLSPTEAIDRVLATLDLAALCRRWPDPAQRLANLDALRGLAARYEERCLEQREAGTVVGLLRFFEEAARKVLVRDEEIASDDQHTTVGPDTVTLVTYHRSKGLEWPVVVLASLDRERRRSIFEVSPETDRAAFDPDNPLGGRWIRYLPWPFGPKRAVRLRETAEASPEGRAMAEREERERVRLLYVGFTRARDHLVLAVRTRKDGYDTEWLDELCDETGAPLVTLPSASEIAGGSAALGIGAEPALSRFPARCWTLSAVEPSLAEDSAPDRSWFVTVDEEAPRPDYWIAPSRAVEEWPDLPPLVPDEIVATGERLPLGPDRRAEWDVVGNALHAFLAADLPELDAAARRARAERLLAAAELLALLAPDALLRAGDTLRSWIQARWPGAVWHREVPVTAVIPTAQGRRRVEGTIDLLLECDGGVVLIDHKTYPGRRDTWRDKAAEYGPQLAAYSEALSHAGKPVLEQWVSFAVAGGAVRLVRPRESKASPSVRAGA